MAQDMTLLWGSGSPPCWRVMIALEEKNLQGYNQKLLSFEKGEHKSQEVLDMNARGQLPSFKHGDVVLNESYAACFYLELDEGIHLAGLFFTLADVVVFPTVATLFRFGLSAERYPKLGDYYAVLKHRPSIKASWPPHWLENPKGQDTLKDV
ncbi:Glutathione S-transferase A [Liparis tanakae]|uniref:Glutathione S-transferase A n=1 Tax=Liparis tanakae TaxID=230148 RepID=A0A4Z2J791_9TELE|nr:Glutathione S-transferase A [Liparis tanakae]